MSLVLHVLGQTSGGATIDRDDGLAGNHVPEERIYEGVVVKRLVDRVLRVVEKVDRNDLAERFFFHVRQNVGRPHRTLFQGGPDREFSQGIVVERERQADLFQIIQAARTAGRLPGGLHRWQQQGDENPDDCDNNQKFDERKGAATPVATISKPVQHGYLKGRDPER